MAMFMDARVPVLLDGVPVVRSPAAMALAGLFAARARGGVPFFKRVVVLGSPAARAEVEAILAVDPLVSARYRLSGAPGS